MLLHDESPAAVVTREEAFVLGTYARTPFHPVSGSGCRLIDADGKAYWDLLGGIAVNVLGHRHPRITRTVKTEASQLLHVSNLYFHPAQGLLAEALVRASLLSRVFFCNSGTEANEAALKFARLANPGRSGIVALAESFHGRTFGSLSVTGHAAYREPFSPLLSGVSFVEPNDVEALEAAVTETTAAIILEPILGEGGIVPLSDEFLIAARRAADRTGAILIVDEIQCGLGRTGSMFAYQRSGIVPDIITLAKPLGGGLPLGAVITGPAIESVVKPGHHGTTFGGNPVACRLGLVVLQEVEKLLPRIRSIGTWFGSALDRLQKRSPAVVAHRGAGLMWGIELDRPAAPVARALLERGIVVGTARENVVRLLPPYIVPKKALEEFIEALEDILRVTSGTSMVKAHLGDEVESPAESPSEPRPPDPHPAHIHQEELNP
ncbi:MAG TPA: acetylornithine/succinylornithine family transaminase [Thermoanaerobaculia bacterium]|nr:acetylornithine/succinylornithine family transaminase [Thermoanaerobaculia bacterium]